MNESEETNEKSFDFMNKSELQGRFEDVLNEAILDPYFSDDFDLDSMSYSDLEDLLNSVYDELNKVQDRRKERILEKNARRLESLLDDGGNSGEGFQLESSEEDDVQTTSIKLNPSDYEWICKALDSTPEEMDVPSEEATWKVTGKFDDGTECDIILHASEDDFYLDGVLYDEDGSELCMTEPCYDILDDWEFEYDGTKYICTVSV